MKKAISEDTALIMAHFGRTQRVAEHFLNHQYKTPYLAKKYFTPKIKTEYKTKRTLTSITLFL